jgi:hypothetical protein
MLLPKGLLMRQNQARNLTLWVLLPLLVGAIPFIRRFLLRSAGLWFFDANISISIVIFAYTLSYCIVRQGGNLRLINRVLLGVLLAQPPILLLSFLGGPIEENQWAVALRNLIRDDGGLQAMIGLFQGLCGAYVYVLGIRIGQSFHYGSHDNLINNLRSFVTIVSFFSVIVAIAIFSVQTSYTVYWPLRSIILVSGLMLGAVAIATGASWGRGANVLLFLLGGVFNFSISFVFGTMIIPLTRIGDVIFPAMAAFTTNSLLAIGLISHIINDEKSFISSLVRVFINKMMRI